MTDRELMQRDYRRGAGRAHSPDLHRPEVVRRHRDDYRRRARVAKVHGWRHDRAYHLGAARRLDLHLHLLRREGTAQQTSACPRPEGGTEGLRPNFRTGGEKGT